LCSSSFAAEEEKGYLTQTWGPVLLAMGIMADGIEKVTVDGHDGVPDPQMKHIFG